LFRAAISAFCSLTRPSRREIAQLDDLALPLFDSVSAEARRFAAAALSECGDVPPSLVRRLADEPVEISAPLLVRSPALRDVDLIGLIGRHGIFHARAIARRPGLNPVIGRLLDLLGDPEIRRLRSQDQRPDLTLVAERAAASPAAPAHDAAENVRHRLRRLMHGAECAAPPAGQSAPPIQPAQTAPPATAASSAVPQPYVRLLDAALTGHLPLFQMALADALDLEFATACAIAEPTRYANLIVALRALDLSEAQAFLLTAMFLPSVFDGPEAIRLFVSRYRLLEQRTVRRRLQDWRSKAEGSGGTTAPGSAPAHRSPSQYRPSPLLSPQVRLPRS
jgi:uncharacterized protein (DUF2336 family)